MGPAASFAIRGEFFFGGAMLALMLGGAADTFVLGHYEHKWTPAENFWLATLAEAFLMFIVAIFFALPSSRSSRRAVVSRVSCAMLGIAYGAGLFLLPEVLTPILSPEGWPFVAVTWGFLLGAPPLLGFLVSRRRSLERGA
jgi:hypothetical protein